MVHTAHACSLPEGLGTNPRCHKHCSGQRWLRFCSPTPLAFSVCFERALRYVIFVGLFLLNNNNNEQNTDPLPRLGCSKSTPQWHHWVRCSLTICSRNPVGAALKAPEKSGPTKQPSAGARGLASTAYNTASFPSPTIWSHGKSELSYDGLP